MPFPKHEATTAPRKGARKQPQPAVTIKPPKPHNGSMDIESAIDGLTSVISTYVSDARNAEHEQTVCMSTGRNSLPVRLELEGEHIERIGHAIDCSHDALSDMATAAERIATAFERIATALETK